MKKKHPNKKNNQTVGWGDEEIELLIELRGLDGMTWEKIRTVFKEKFGQDVATNTLAKKYERIVLKPTATNLEVEFPKKPEDLSFEETMDAFIAAKDIGDKFNIGEYMVTIGVKTDIPIAISFLSDVHMGSPVTDYEGLRDDLKLIETHPQLFMFAGGDWNDSFLPSFRNAGAVLNQLVSPDIQFKATSNILKHFCDKKKLLAKSGGNHDAFMTKVTGVDMNFWILKGEKPPYLPYGGLIKLTVGKQTYNILWKHKWRYNSSLNEFNTHHRAYEILYPNADIVVMEHNHTPGIETIEKGEFDAKKTLVNIRTGGYKVGDAYSRTYFKDGRRGAQTVILYPEEHRLVPMHGAKAIEDATIYLRGLE